MISHKQVLFYKDFFEKHQLSPHFQCVPCDELFVKDCTVECAHISTTSVHVTVDTIHYNNVLRTEFIVTLQANILND